MILFPMHANSGRQVSKSPASPPTKKVSCDAAAMSLEPLTGAPRKRMRCACDSAAIFLENDGLTVLQSLHIWPGANRERNPAWPKAASSTAAGCASIVKTTFTCDAKLAGESAHCAPL